MDEQNVIFLNGASSSGKSTLAHTLQELSDVASFHFALDEYYAMLPRKILKQIFVSKTEANKDVLDWCHFWEGFYRAAQSVAASGNKVIIDSVCYGSILDMCLEIFERSTVIYVGLKCPLHVLQQRESRRGDRIIGLAESQYKIIHAGQSCDIELDTSISSPKECAETIMGWLDAGHQPQAFDQMRRKRDATISHRKFVDIWL